MNNVKKIVGILLAVAMLVSAMSTVAGAAVADGASINYVVMADKATYSAGDTATFTVYAEVAADAAPTDGTVELLLNYKGSQFSPIADYADSALATHGVDLTSSPLEANISATDSYVMDGSADAMFDGDIYEGMDESIWIALVGISGDGLEGYATGLTEVLKFQLKVDEDLAKDSFKVLVDIGMSYMTLDGDHMDNQFDPSYATTEFDCRKVYNKATQIQWANEEKTAVNLGFKGYFDSSVIDIAFTDNKSTNVAAVGAKVTIGDSDEVTKTTRWVYTPDSGATYEFRAIVSNLDVETYGDTTISVVYFVQMTNGEVYESAAITDTVNNNIGRLS